MQTALYLGGDGSVRTRTYVEEQVAVLGDDVDQLMDDTACRLVVGMLEIAPGVPVHYVIGLPDEAGLLGQLPGLDVDQARAGGEVIVLVGHDDFAPGTAAGVVEVGEHLQPVGFRNDDDAAIEINQVWLVAVNHLEDLIAPNLAKA